MKLFLSAKKPGFVTLISVLVVGAIALAIGTTLILLGLDAGVTSLASEQSLQARALADMCAEQSLMELKNDPTLAELVVVNGALALPVGNCTYQITGMGGEAREIETLGQFQGSIRRLRINLDQITPQIHLTSWQEVADF